MLFSYIGHYYTWAHDKYRKLVAEISDEDFDKKDEDIERSVRDIIIHIAFYSLSYYESYDTVKLQTESMQNMNKGKLIDIWKEIDESFAAKVNENYGGTTQLQLNNNANVEIGKNEWIFAYTDHATFHRGQLLSLVRKYTGKGINSDFYSYLLVKYS